MSTIVLRSVKGTPLTNAEVDANFNNLNLEKVETLASADGSVVITGTGASLDLSVSLTSPASVLVEQVRNTTGATLTKGTAVYISGATGQTPTVSKALATGDATSAQTLGLITADLANNANGYVTIIGLISNINTSAYTDGAQLYLSPTTAGTLTATKPYAPQHLVYVAVVAHAHITQGKLLVKVQNGYEMDELHNVSAQSPSNGQTLVYNTSTSLWEKSFAPILSSATGLPLSTGVSGTLPVANGGTGATTSTGSGAVVLATSPTLVTPLLGTPTSGTLTNTTGLPLTTGVTGTLPVANGGTGLTSGTSGGVLAYTAAGTLASSGVLAANALVIGGGAGVAPSTTTTGTGVLTFLGTPSSANLASAVTDETGSGSLVFSTSPTVNNPTVTNYVESVVAIGTVTTTNTIALTNGTVQTATLTASTACTFTMPTATAGKSFVLLLKQAATTGNGTATFTGVKFGSAGAPTITATAGKMDILTFIADGTNWYGSAAQGYTP